MSAIPMLLPAISLLALAIWLGMALARAAFWRIERDPVPAPPPEWPGVVAIIPARNEAASLPDTLRSLWAQDYAGPLRVVVVDDHSEDGTTRAAAQTAREEGREAGLTVLPADELPVGWAGKVWAMQQGLARGVPAGDPARYVLFSDADIHHGSGALRELVCRAEAGPCDLASFMVRLRCHSAAERLTIPAFVFFFRMLYPFRRVNDPLDPLAGAAGGTMLVRREAIARIGGLERIRGALIDDCALAGELKRGGHRIWLGLSAESVSTRRYERLAEVLQMVSRSAYTQLGCSPWRLLACVAGLAVTFLAPPLLVLAGGWPALLGALAWLLMSLLYAPMVRFYRLSAAWAPLLPVAAALYLWATALSAWQHHTGRGGQWKGRTATRGRAPQG